MRLFSFLRMLMLAIFCIIPATAFTQGTDLSLSGGVNRAELAAALLRVEQTYYAQTWDDENNATFNKGFDDASLMFFGGDFPEALKALNLITLNWNTIYKTHPTLPFLASLRVSPTQRVFALDSGKLPELAISLIYDLPDAPKPKRIKIEMAPYSQKTPAPDTLLPLLTFDLPDFTSTPTLLTLTPPEAGFSPGLYNLFLSDPDSGEGDARWLCTTWTIVESPLAKAMEENKVALAALPPLDPSLESAKIAVEMRNGLLTDKPTDQKSTDYVLNPAQILGEVRDEIKILQENKNPFTMRKGDYWRVYKTAAGKIPARVYVPESLNLDAPIPLLIAFHGAGGDENMFMEAYGLGRIKDLADEHGFLLLSPLTYPFTGGWTAGKTLEQILDTLKTEYPVDEKNIFILGHSMGGGATSALLEATPNTFASAACLCGVSALTPSENFPRTLLVAAEHDPLARVDKVTNVYTTAKDAGLPVEFWEKKHYGHTLVIGEILPDVIDWLMKQN